MKLPLCPCGWSLGREKPVGLYKISVVIIFLLWGILQPTYVQAEEYSLPPHLIQSVSGQDIYEGLLALDLLQCPVLEREDPEAACENVKDSIVRIDMDGAYGSGVIFRMTEQGAVIATNRHVLAYWEDEAGAVCFPQGWYVGARMLGCSETCDVGFLRVNQEELGLEALMKLRSVPVDESAYDSLRGGEAAFSLGADRARNEIVCQEARMEETDRYIDTFGGKMLYGRGFAKEGMSGGGIFDCYGHFIGLLAGGTWQNEIAGVPLGEVEQAYREIVEE